MQRSLFREQTLSGDVVELSWGLSNNENHFENRFIIDWTLWAKNQRKIPKKWEFSGIKTAFFQLLYKVRGGGIENGWVGGVSWWGSDYHDTSEFKNGVVWNRTDHKIMISAMNYFTLKQRHEQVQQRRWRQQQRTTAEPNQHYKQNQEDNHQQTQHHHPSGLGPSLCARPIRRRTLLPGCDRDIIEIHDAA